MPDKMFAVTVCTRFLFPVFLSPNILHIYFSVLFFCRTINWFNCNNVRGIKFNDDSDSSARPPLPVPEWLWFKQRALRRQLMLSACWVVAVLWVGEGRARGAPNRTGPRVPPAAPCLWGGDGELLVEVGKRWLINFPLSLPLIFLGHLPGPPIRNVQQLFAASVFAVWTRTCARVLA